VTRGASRHGTVFYVVLIIINVATVTHMGNYQIREDTYQDRIGDQYSTFLPPSSG